VRNVVTLGGIIYSLLIIALFISIISRTENPVVKFLRISHGLETAKIQNKEYQRGYELVLRFSRVGQIRSPFHGLDIYGEGRS